MSKLPPSQKRIRNARKQGKVYKSQLVTRALIYIVLCGITFLMFSWIWVRFRTLLLWGMLADAELSLAINYALSSLAIVISISMATCALSGLCSEFLQVGFHYHNVGFNLEKLSPSRFFSSMPSSLKRGVLGVVGAVCFVSLFLLAQLDLISHLSDLFFINPQFFDLIQYIRNHFILFAKCSTAIFIIIALVDLKLVKIRFMKELGMSPEDQKREFKEEEGDPQIKGYRKMLHATLSREEKVARLRRCKVLIVARSKGDA